MNGYPATYVGPTVIGSSRAPILIEGQWVIVHTVAAGGAGSATVSYDPADTRWMHCELGYTARINGVPLSDLQVRS